MGLTATFLLVSAAISFTGIIIAGTIALIGGYISGLMLSLFGRRLEAYVDAEEFIDA